MEPSTNPDQAPSDAADATTPDATSGRRSILAVTACPTGIAHTYMAADSLESAAGDVGVDFAAETQGSSGLTPFTTAQIADADAVVFAADVPVRDRGRFAGLPVVETGVKRAITEPGAVLADALAAADDPDAPRVEASAGDATGPGSAPEASTSTRRKWFRKK